MKRSASVQDDIREAQRQAAKSRSPGRAVVYDPAPTTAPYQRHHARPSIPVQVESTSTLRASHQQKMQFANQLWPKVALLQPSHAGEITGLLAELDMPVWAPLMDSPSYLRERVDDAMNLIRAQKTLTAAALPPSSSTSQGAQGHHPVRSPPQAVPTNNTGQLPGILTPVLSTAIPVAGSTPPELVPEELSGPAPPALIPSVEEGLQEPPADTHHLLTTLSRAVESRARRKRAASA